MLPRLVLLATLVCSIAHAEPDRFDRIIPRPVEVTPGEGRFPLRDGAQISAPTSLANEVMALRNALEPATGFRFPDAATPEEGSFVFVLDPDAEQFGDEGYSLAISDDHVRIRAGKPAGVFYGIQSLLQLLPPEIRSQSHVAGVEWEIPVMNVHDRPRFGWRAFLLDEARHFKGEGEVKKLLDQMAALKMNRFHWHLTDDQGWRVEIKRYPKLTEIGSKRSDTQVGGWDSPDRSGEPHGGFYTQDEIREIVSYAAARHITIVPEIGMPGHAVAAIASYPELGTTKKKIDVMTVFGKAEDVYDPSSEFTYEFLKGVLEEIVDLFPSKVVHIGGDEVRFEQWQESRAVRELMKRQGLDTMADVQIYFTNRMVGIVGDLGRDAMGWNEILGDDLHGFLKDGQTAKSGSLDPRTIVHFWKGSADLARKAIAKGHRIVNSWHSYTYLDYGYGVIPLEKAYGFEPVFDGLTPEEEESVMGMGCQMWGEWIPTVELMESQVYPRIAAYSEVAWSQKSRKDLDGFRKRLALQLLRWSLQGISYADVLGDPYSAEDFFNWREIGRWTPGGNLDEWNDMVIPLDVATLTPGKFEVVFLYEKGEHALGIERVELLGDGERLSVDEHVAFSGSRLDKIVFRLHLNDVDRAGDYSIRARVKGHGGHDSYGVIKINPIE